MVGHKNNGNSCWNIFSSLNFKIITEMLDVVVEGTTVFEKKVKELKRAPMVKKVKKRFIVACFNSYNFTKNVPRPDKTTLF